MAIDQAALRRHLDDYARTRRQSTDRFICPVTFRPCAEEELVNGHILPEGLNNASSKTVIQYGKLDFFYGSRVEDTLIRYLNLSETSSEDVVRHCDELTVRFSDGAAIPAFVAEGAAAMKAKDKFPSRKLYQNGNRFLELFIKAKFDDPRLREEQLTVSAVNHWMPDHWVAALLKSGYLTLFYTLGYSAVFDSIDDSVRQALASYFNDGAKSDEVGKYFSGFRNAVKIILDPQTRDKAVPQTRRFNFDSLDDRQFLFHYTPSDVMFAMTCVFHVNRGSVAVTMPQTMQVGGIREARETYEALMRDEKSVQQTINQVSFDGERWSLVGAVSVEYLTRQEFQVTENTPKSS